MSLRLIQFKHGGAEHLLREIVIGGVYGSVESRLAHLPSGPYNLQCNDVVHVSNPWLSW